jgi:cytochrome c peroxidase
LPPPPNGHRANALSEKGRRVFSREGCNACHTAPLYTSNALTPASGFSVPPEHLERYNIVERSVGTDPELAMRTRKGTGYYKVPSLKGVWYRGPFQHAGAVPTLADWFDPGRLQRVPGHPFGLTLPADDRTALIAYLETL